MNKEDLIKQIAVLTEKYDTLVAKDNKRAESISKILGSYRLEEDNSYGFSLKGSIKKVPNILSWPEIFAELGKLLARQKALTYVENIENYRLEVQELRNLVEELRQSKK